jgi:hypothetical protein
LALKTYKACLPDNGWRVLTTLRGIIQANQFLLAGGTALALQKGHRISYDLDFFTLLSFSNDKLISEIKKTAMAAPLPEHLLSAGLLLDFQIVAEEEGSLTLEIERVKVSFFRYEYPFLDRIVEIKQTRMAGVLDIAAMKVIAIIQRGAKRDFIDLYTILQEIPFHKLAGHMIKRFGKERVNPVQMGKSLVYFADADTNPEPAYRKGVGLSWEDVRKFFRTHVKQFVFDLEAAKKESGEQ